MHIPPDVLFPPDALLPPDALFDRTHIAAGTDLRCPSAARHGDSRTGLAIPFPILESAQRNTTPSPGQRTVTGRRNALSPARFPHSAACTAAPDLRSVPGTLVVPNQVAPHGAPSLVVGIAHHRPDSVDDSVQSMHDEEDRRSGQAGICTAGTSVQQTPLFWGDSSKKGI